MCEHPEQLMEQAIQNNARVVLDQDKYNEEFDEITEKFNSTREKYDAVNEQIDDKKTRHIQAGQFIKILLSEDGSATFSPIFLQSSSKEHPVQPFSFYPRLLPEKPREPDDFLNLTPPHIGGVDIPQLCLFLSPLKSAGALRLNLTALVFFHLGFPYE